MSCIITGIGVVTTLGSNMKEITGLITHGENRPDHPHLQKNGQAELFKAKTDKITDFFPKKLLRRTDHFSKMALLAASLAIEDSGESRKNWSGDETGIIIATGYGSINSTCLFKDSIFASSDKGPSPLLFSRSVHNQAASHLAILLGITGPNLTVSQHYLSFHCAMQTAFLWLTEKRVRRVIVGGVDEYNDVLAYCRKRFLQTDIKKTADPSLQDNTCIPGEGAGFFLLEESDTKKGPVLDMVVIGRKTDKLSADTRKQRKTVCYDCSRPSSVMSEKDTGNRDPRRFYGEFPTAAALDLAYALCSAPGGQDISSIQITGGQNYGIIDIKNSPS